MTKLASQHLRSPLIGGLRPYAPYESRSGACHPPYERLITLHSSLLRQARTHQLLVIAGEHVPVGEGGV